jgi:branched-chain amino acid transport system substrate-binding protein
MMSRWQAIRPAVWVVALMFATQIVGGPGMAATGAPKEILIGSVFPLTGPFGGVGEEELWADQTAVDVINNAHPDITIYFAATQGLPNLGGAKIRVVVRDDQGKGDLSRTAAVQLITSDKVAWLNGTGISGTTAVIQPVAEQYGIPYSCHECAAPSLTEKGFKTFFRICPSDTQKIGAAFTFLKEWPNHGGPGGLKTAAVLVCDNVYCQDGRKVALGDAQTAGFSVVADLTTKIGATSLASEVQRLQAANPDVLFVQEYTSDATLLQSAMKTSGWMPKAVVTSGGFWDDQNWLEEQKKTNGGVGWIGGDSTAVNLDRKNPNWVKVNAIYKKYSRGQDMGVTAEREFTGMLWTADVINRARSTDPQALLRAAAQTQTDPKNLIIGYKGIKLNSHGQNVLALGVASQIGWDNEKHLIWPWDLAAPAGYKIIFPSPSWDERAKHPVVR